MNNFLSKTVFFVAFCLMGIFSVQAQKIYIYDTVFTTNSAQSMWGNGDDFSLDFDYALFDEGWSTGGGFDFTESICGAEFGLGLNASTSGSMGMNFYMNGLTSGTIDKITYPLEIGFITPEPSTINAGQIIEIDSYYKVTGTPEIKTSYPSGGRMGLRFHFGIDNNIGFKGCVFDCAEEDLDIAFDIDTTLFQISATQGETFYLGNGDINPLPGFLCYTPPSVPWPQIIYKDLLPIHISKIEKDCACCDSAFACDSCGCIENCPEIDCNNDEIFDNGTFSVFDYMEADLDIPNVSELQTTIVNTNTIQAVGEDKFINASFDPINALLNFSPYKLKGDVKIPPPVSCLIGIDYNILSTSIDFNIFNKQTFDFTAEAYAKLELPVKVDYQIKNAQNAVIATGKDSIIDYKIGNSVAFRYPCDYEFIDFKPEIYLKNKFTNRTYNDYEVEVPMEALALNITFNKIVVVPEIKVKICLPVVGCETITTPEVAFDPPDMNIGPLWEETFPIGNLEQDIFKKTWEIPGFQRIKVDSFRIAPNRFTLNLNPVDIACNNATTGEIMLSDAGGTYPLTYEWSNGATTRNLQNVKAGDYYVKVTDANQCEAFNGAEIKEPEAIIVTNEITDCLCTQDNTGSIDLSVSGGVKPYIFMWSNGETSEDLNGITAGTYECILSDQNNCQQILEFTVNEPTELTGYVSNYGEPLCHGGSEGFIKYNVSGGTPPYRFHWSNFAVTQNLDSLVAGTYSVTVTDFKGCTFESTQLINEPDELKNQLTMEPVHCYMGADGALETTIYGGTPPYQLTWYSPEYTLNSRKLRIDELTEGLYQIEIYDSNLCFVKDSIWLTAPQAPFYTTLKTTNPSCHNGQDGAIDLETFNGTAPFTYQWSNGAVSQSISELKAGKYDVTVSDNYNCTTKNNTVLIEPLAFTADVEITQVSCEEETDGKIQLSPQGATPPYEIIWSNNETGTFLDNLAQGIYTASIADANNCLYTIEVEMPVNGVGCVDIPSAFTPNADGINDSWVIRSIKKYPDNQIKIFTKWGELIFSSSGDDAPWDGTNNGKDCPAATYYYVVNLGNGEPLYKGLVTIVR
jgi:gliding motility-associated-like protein